AQGRYCHNLSTWIPAPAFAGAGFAGMTHPFANRGPLSRPALGRMRHFFFAASAASRAVSFSYDALSKLPPEPFATSRTTAHVVLQLIGKKRSAPSNAFCISG